MILFPILVAALLTQSPSHSSQRRPPRAPETVPQPTPSDAKLVADATPPKTFAKPALSAQTRAAHSLVHAELAFADMAGQEGNDAAFLSVLDDMGVLFRPGPVNGKAWLRKQKLDTSKLTWFPSYVEVSEAGDLGYSTGPYQWRAEAESKEASHGHFVSVWGRRGGSWKLLLDLGSPHAAPGELDPVFEPENAKGTGKSEVLPPFSAEALQNLEKEFSNAASVRGILSAYNTYLASDARFYRAGAQPTAQLDDIRKALERVKGTVKWTCLGSVVAKSNDLGYAYGISELIPTSAPSSKPGAAPTPTVQNSSFLHVWKRQPSGRWKVILDIENPIQ